MDIQINMTLITIMKILDVKLIAPINVRPVIQVPKMMVYVLFAKIIPITYLNVYILNKDGTKYKMDFLLIGQLRVKKINY